MGVAFSYERGTPVFARQLMRQALETLGHARSSSSSLLLSSLWGEHTPSRPSSVVYSREARESERARERAIERARVVSFTQEKRESETARETARERQREGARERERARERESARERERQSARERESAHRVQGYLAHKKHRESASPRPRRLPRLDRRPLPIRTLLRGGLVFKAHRWLYHSTLGPTASHPHPAQIQQIVGI